MANVTYTARDDGLVDQTSATSYTTASVTAVASKLYVVLFFAESAADLTAVDPTVSGAGLGTWVKIASSLVSGTSSKIWAYRALSPSPGAGATVLLDFGATTMTQCGWFISHFDNMDTSGTNGSGAVPQSKTGTNTGTSISVTLDSALRSTESMTHAVALHFQNEASTVGNGYSTIGDFVAAGSKRWTGEVKTNDTVAGFSWATNVTNGMLAIEIAAGSASTPQLRTVQSTQRW